MFIIVQSFGNWGITQSRDAFRPIACDGKYMMDYKYILLDILVCSIAVYCYELCSISTTP